ncbi:MAG: SAM-dependent methyltransferase [Pseudomonadota bacterium]
MNPLDALISTEIETTGPITVGRYMQLCLSHPKYGYYTSKQPLGAQGDFTTAPEISQLFGELVGVWLVTVWRALGQPSPFALVELGPGRGTLMADILRAVAVDRAFTDGCKVHLVELSKPLRDLQSKTLQSSSIAPTFHSDIASLPKLPTLFVANEFFDALPTNQWVRTDRGWNARKIGLDADNKLTFGVDPTPLPAPPKLIRENAALGTIVEHSPAQDTIMGMMADRIVRYGGAALITDYGSLSTGFGDTLQAVRMHRPADPLDDPGASDLTTQTDFGHLRSKAIDAGVRTTAWSAQGDFLIAMGLLERAGVLGANAGPEERDAISAAVERLASDAAMGKLFKAMALASKEIHLPGLIVVND